MPDDFARYANWVLFRTRFASYWPGRALVYSGIVRLIKMRMAAVGHLLFALGLTGMGLLSLGSGDFAYTWQPVPQWVMWRTDLAYISGAFMVAAGIGMVLKPVAHRCAIAMTLYLVIWVVLLQSPHVIQAPLNVGAWLGVSESTVLMCGGWILCLSLARVGKTSRTGFLTDPRIPRFLFGASCLVLGLSHFVYIKETAGMVPAWLPAPTFFAYLTGCGHFAAGLAILSGVVPRLAATLEASMICTFVLLLHAPAVASAPGSRLQWTMFFVASALGGSAWLVASSLRASVWGWGRTSAPIAGVSDESQAA